MCVQISKSLVFIQRILLYINSRRINMCSQNIHSFLYRRCSCLEKYNGLPHIIHIYFIPCMNLCAGFDQIFHIPVSLCLCQFNRLFDAFTFRLTFIQTCTILRIHFFQLPDLRFTVRLP